MQSATIFDDPQAPGGRLFRDAMIEQDDTIGNVLFEAKAGHRPVPAFGGDHRAHTLIFQPAEQPAELRPKGPGPGVRCSSRCECRSQELAQANRYKV